MSKKVQKTQGACVAPFIYEYAPNGEMQGYQVRFKRAVKSKRGAKRGKAKSESCSLYFSFSKWGTRALAMAAAKQWRNENTHWRTDHRFKLTEGPEPKEAPLAKAS